MFAAKFMTGRGDEDGQAHHSNFLEDICSFINLALFLLELGQLLGQASTLYLHKDLHATIAM